MGKIYLYYLIPNESLYAYTENKEFDKRFCKERKIENFHRVVKKTSDYDENEIRLFRSNCRTKQLIEIPLTDKQGNNIGIIGTYQEDQMLTSAVEELQTEIDCIKSTIVDDLHYNEEYFSLKFVADIENFLEYIQPIGEMTECVEFPVEFDTFHLFTYIFHRTFYAREIWTHVEEADIGLTQRKIE